MVRRFGNFTAVDDVSFTVPRGQFFSILGPSGCGKTTLMRMIAGFDEPNAGDIHIKGEAMRGVPPNRRPANMVFQHLALFPMMTVADNVGYGLRRRKEPRTQIARKVQDALERVSLPDAGRKQIRQLSGGQQQRVAIARSLVLEPRVLLLDEPLGALDLKLREHMKVELKQLQQQVGTTFVYITHDQSEALVMSDHVAVMNAGHFEQVGTPQELYYQPRTAFVAGFVGDANRWLGRIKEVQSDQLEVETDTGLSFRGVMGEAEEAQVGGRVEVFVRPESVVLELAAGDLPGDRNQLQCRVKDLLFNGANSSALLEETQSGGEILVRLPQTGEFAHLQRRQALRIHWRARHTPCFIHRDEA